MADVVQHHDSRNGHHEVLNGPHVTPALIRGDVVRDRLTEEKFEGPVLTVVVPTRNEAGNVPELVRRLEKIIPDIPLEIVFVDDSDDETPAVVEAVAEKSSRDVILVHRVPNHRQGGLGGAVIEGFRIARAPWVCVMDGDLQHPPELIPELLLEAERKNAELVVASRHRDQGNADGLNIPRMIVSQSFDTLARLMFHSRLEHVSDPMSGFFLIRRRAVDVDHLRPTGFKILLEIIVRSRRLRVSEVPFEFGERFAGESKANTREGFRYLKLLWRLRFGEDTRRFVRFATVGASGLVVNTLFLASFTGLLDVHYLVSAILSTQGSTLWNFAFTEFWVFKERQQRWGRVHRLIMFLLMNTAALGLRGPLMFTMTTGLGIHYLVSNLVSLVALTFLRFALSDAWIWGRSRSGDAADTYGLEASRI